MLSVGAWLAPRSEVLAQTAGGRGDARQARWQMSAADVQQVYTPAAAAART